MLLVEGSIVFNITRLEKTLSHFLIAKKNHGQYLLLINSIRLALISKISKMRIQESNQMGSSHFTKCLLRNQSEQIELAVSSSETSSAEQIKKTCQNQMASAKLKKSSLTSSRKTTRCNKTLSEKSNIQVVITKNTTYLNQ
jgi:folate-binding Fe-S cluster repair protein YgfZ